MALHVENYLGSYKIIPPMVPARSSDNRLSYVDIVRGQ